MDELLRWSHLSKGQGGSVAAADYLEYVRQNRRLNYDTFLALCHFMLPTFVVKEGVVLINEINAPKRFAEFRTQGKSIPEAQFWANLMLVTDFVAAESVEDAVRLAQLLATSWRQTLLAAGLSHEPVHVLRLRMDLDEVFVVVSAWSAIQDSMKC